MISDAAVVHVQSARPGDGRRIQVELIAVKEMRVDQGSEQVMRRGDGVEIAVKVQIDLFRWLDLRASAAGGSALHAEDRAERRLARADNGAFADPLQALHQSNRGDGLAFTGNGRSGCCDEDEFAAAVKARVRQQIEAELGADGAAFLVERIGKVELCGDGFDREQGLSHGLPSGLVTVTEHGRAGCCVPDRNTSRAVSRQVLDAASAVKALDGIALGILEP
jgi:hypothetical protein